jgi:chromate transporter
VLFDHLQENSMTQAAIHGAVAAAVGITVKTFWTIAGPHFKARARLRVALIGIAAFALHVFLAVPAINVLLIAAAVGFLVPGPQS